MKKAPDLPDCPYDHFCRPCLDILIPGAEGPYCQACTELEQEYDRRHDKYLAWESAHFDFYLRRN